MVYIGKLKRYFHNYMPNNYDIHGTPPLLKQTLSWVFAKQKKKLFLGGAKKNFEMQSEENKALDKSHHLCTTHKSITTNDICKKER